MRYRKNFILPLFLLMTFSNLLAQSQKDHFTLLSPDRQTRFEITPDANAQLVYRIFYSGKAVTNWSPLGLHLTNGATLGNQASIINGQTARHSGKFYWPLGDNDTITNNYNQLTLNCRSAGNRFQVIARVFNGSVAFRYKLGNPPGDSVIIDHENTAFHFPEPYTIYQYQQESVFTPVMLDSLAKPCDIPATLSSADLYISINEADNANYTKAVLEKGDGTHSLKIAFVRDAVKASGHFLTPWRTISFSRTAVGLGRYTDLLLKLCPPATAGIPQWIRPGKLIRSQLTTKSGRECIDFAASHNFQYVLFDAGWYGKEFNSVSDPTTYIDGLDIPGVIKYGRSKNIGIILYVNYVGLRKYLDRILPLYKSWGVAGMKFGFVNGLTQEGISWLMAAVKKASAEGFIIDIHDNYKPTGMSRRYSALLTQEGVRGNEHGPDAFHNTVLPFTRFLSGAADYTFCYPGSDTGFNRYLEKEKLKVSKAQQLALSVIYFSPLQSMLWYGLPSYYTNETDVEFFKEVPTVWDRSIYLKGRIGQYASIARKHGQDWFIGSISGPDEWSDNIRLDFLDKGITYKADIYEDDGEGHIKKKSLYCKRADFLPVHLAAGSGQAVRLSPSIKSIDQKQ